MRRTVHLVTADDALAWRARHDAMLRQRVLGEYHREFDRVDLDELATAARAVLADERPRTMPELGRTLNAHWPAVGPRALPAFDNAILGYHDRSRIIDHAHRGLSVAGERGVLVDGRVTATWTAEAGTVIIAPLRRLSRAEHTAVAEQERELALFLSDDDSDRVQVAAFPR
ncbi:MAG: hypothetical protein JWQ81_7291 [Amycolatopsis sp.]|nr:hypothetical protein [Amycolatopsis sp.]